MKKEHIQLLEKFADSHLPPSWRHDLQYLNGWKAAEVLWPMNDVFKQFHSTIRFLPYSEKYENEANQAIEDYVSGTKWSILYPSPPVWRVLFERHIQALMLCAINGEQTVIVAPAQLPHALQLKFIMLDLQWDMKLPFPVADRSDPSWLDALTKGNLQRH
ncbi:MAG: hypothetical protein KGO49_00680 [Gammaproteobacteria bacterium]|nr:hypothetical protein [Gammaproteobacteria bacterium]